MENLNDRGSFEKINLVLILKKIKIDSNLPLLPISIFKICHTH